MKVLMVTGVTPVPPDRGDRIRAQHLLNVLIRKCEVHLALLGDHISPVHEQELCDLGVRIHSIQVSPYDRGVGVFRGIVRRRPWSMLVARNLRRRLREIQEAFDIVVAFQLKTALIAGEVPTRLRILDLTDSLGLYRSLMPNRNLRWLALQGAYDEESYWAIRYDYTLLSSIRDLTAIQRVAPRTNAMVVENGSIPWDTPVKSGKKENLLFVGNLDYLPNLSGLASFVDHTWPHVYQQTGTRLRVVGQVSRKAARRLSRPGVEVLGYVKELRAEYERALALVNPIVFGTGTRSKVLEAWAAGLPVISTPEGVAGLEYLEGTHILHAGSPCTWAGAVTRLQSDHKLWESMNLGTWAHIRDRYNATRIWEDAMSVILSR